VRKKKLIEGLEYRQLRLEMAGVQSVGVRQRAELYLPDQFFDLPDHRFIDAEMAVPQLAKLIRAQIQTKRSAHRGPNLVRLELAPMNVVPQPSSNARFHLWRGNARPLTHAAKEKLIVVKDQYVAQVEEDRLNACRHSLSRSSRAPCTERKPTRGEQ